jgi:hypothetical protein
MCAQPSDGAPPRWCAAWIVTVIGILIRCRDLLDPVAYEAMRAAWGQYRDGEVRQAADA